MTPTITVVLFSLGLGVSLYVIGQSICDIILRAIGE